MPNINDYFAANHGVIWVQTEGPNTVPKFLGCHEIGDLTEPGGDVSRVLCPDPRSRDKWNVVLRQKGAPGAPTFTITTLTPKIAGWLERAPCPLSFYVLQDECADRRDFLSYERGLVLQYSMRTELTEANLASREGTDEATQAFDFDAAVIERFYQVELSAQVTDNPDDLLDVAFCNYLRCRGACGPFQDICDDGWACGGSDVATYGCLIKTHDAGNTWTLSPANPFLVAENISSVVCFPVARNTTRVIVARGSTDGANPAEVAYSDDDGVTWTLVNVGATVGEFVPWNGGLFAVDKNHIWLVTDQGAIFFSDDGGASWTEQVTTNVALLNYVRFIDENHGLAVGATNAILYTDDGGEHWTTITGPAGKAADNILTCEILDAHNWWLGYDDGELFYTMDGGTTWTQRTFTVPGAATVDRVNDMMFYDDFNGYAVVKWTDGDAHLRGAILRTFNGGQDWEVHSIATQFDVGALGLNAVWACNYNLAYSVGDMIDAVGSIYTLAD